MRLLIDTHLLLWATAQSPRLPRAAFRLINDAENDLIFSVPSIWEYGVKFAKAPERFGLPPHQLREVLLDNGYTEMDITGRHVLAISNLPRIHGDPFDRILIAQAMVEGITLLTTDATVARYEGPIRKV
ncbi:MAG: type II toxin-antitoxin system VapC family toxin [Acidobacteriota bacterium]